RMALPRIGRMWLAGPDGQVHETALYDVPSLLREPVLHLNGGVYRQARQEANGTWVYRYEAKAPTMQSHPHVTDFRDDQHPEWDGPVRPLPPATFADVLSHFQQYRHDGRDEDVQLAKLYDHLVCAMQQQPYRDE